MFWRQFLSQLEGEGGEEGQVGVCLADDLSGLVRGPHSASLEWEVTTSDHIKLPLAGVAGTGALVPGRTLDLIHDLLD